MTDKNSSELSSLKQNMKSSAQAIMKSVKLNPLATENLIKLQQDRLVTTGKLIWKISSERRLAPVSQYFPVM